jgi:uncharacterized protein with GYD domain
VQTFDKRLQPRAAGAIMRRAETPNVDPSETTMMLSTSDAASGVQRPVRVQAYSSYEFRRKHMAFYLTRFSYTPETWARLIKNPEDRRAAARQYIEAVGGKLHGFWYAFGDYDAYNLWEAPDNVSMAATALAISAGGALSSLHTTVLLTVEETVAALQKAASIKYRAPGEKG